MLSNIFTNKIFQLLFSILILSPILIFGYGKFFKSGNGSLISITINGKQFNSKEQIIRYVDTIINDKENEIQLNKELRKKNEQLSDIIKRKTQVVKYFNASFIVDGIKMQSGSIRPVAVIDDEKYLSVPVIEDLLGMQIEVNTINGVVNIISESLKSNQDVSSHSRKIGKFPLMDVCEPYDYIAGQKISDTNWIKISGKQYTDGFILNGDGGEAYINLDKKYTALSFNFGYIHETSKRKIPDIKRRFAEGYRTRVVVLADGKTIMDKIIPLDKLENSGSLALNYAQNLKIELLGTKARMGSGLFGFVNITLSE